MGSCEAFGGPKNHAQLNLLKNEQSLTRDISATDLRGKWTHFEKNTKANILYPNQLFPPLHLFSVLFLGYDNI